MTKAVRIENADTSQHIVRVIVERKNEAGEWVRDPYSMEMLELPTMMVTKYIHAGQRLIVEEVA